MSRLNWLRTLLLAVGVAGWVSACSDGGSNAPKDQAAEDGGTDPGDGGTPGDGGSTSTSTSTSTGTDGSCECPCDDCPCHDCPCGDGCCEDCDGGCCGGGCCPDGSCGDDGCCPGGCCDPDDCGSGGCCPGGCDGECDEDGGCPSEDDEEGGSCPDCPPCPPCPDCPECPDCPGEDCPTPGSGDGCDDDCQDPSQGPCDHGPKSHTPVLADSVNPFELRNMNSSGYPTFKSSDHINGIFVLENYFLNCPYCNDNAENVDALAAQYANDFRIKVLDVGVDRQERQYQAWIDRHQPNHPVLNDGDRALTSQLGTQGYPTTYVLDCHHNVVFRTSGVWNEQKKAAIVAKIEELKDKPCFMN